MISNESFVDVRNRGRTGAGVDNHGDRKPHDGGNTAREVGSGGESGANGVVAASDVWAQTRKREIRARRIRHDSGARSGG